VRASYRGRLENNKRDHRPPLGAQQRRDGNQHGVGRVGIEARVRLGAHRPFLADLEIEQELIGVVLPAEGAERRPFQAFLRGRPEIAVVRGDRSR
jgi:hypothetical protein